MKEGYDASVVIPTFEAYRSACGVLASSCVRYGNLSLLVGFFISFWKVWL